MELVSPDDYTVEPLNTAAHRREDFSCGAPDLDRYLQQQAAQDQSRNVSVCHVLVSSRSDDATEARARPILGFVSLANASLPLVDAPAVLKKITKHAHIPAVMLARLAVDSRHQGHGLGTRLLKFALKSSVEIAALAGCVVVLVDAKDEKARDFYAKYGFIPFPDRPLRLFMSMETIKKLS